MMHFKMPRCQRIGYEIPHGIPNDFVCPVRIELSSHYSEATAMVVNVLRNLLFSFGRADHVRDGSLGPAEFL